MVATRRTLQAHTRAVVQERVRAHASLPPAERVRLDVVRPDSRMGLRALTVRQPYATALLEGRGYETRTWGTEYRGDLLITASLSPADAGPHGCTIGLVRLHACEQHGGAWHWLLDRERPLAHVQIRGNRGLWRVPPELVRALGLRMAPGR